MSKLENYILNTTKKLAEDMLEVNDVKIEDNLINVEVLYSLYAEMMNYKPDKPDWINRDRFVFSDNLNSNVLYATLFMAGFKIDIENLKNYGRLNYLTPFNLDYKVTPGVDVSTDGVGVGLSMAVGLSLVESYLRNLITKIKYKSKLIDYYTYCLCTKRDLMSSSSTLNFAVSNNLNKLILICNEDLEELLTLKLSAIGFNVIKVKKNIVDNICSAIESAQSSKKPNLIIIQGNEEKEEYPQEPFLIDLNNLQKYQLEINERINKKYNKWLLEYEDIRNNQENSLIQIIDFLETGELNINLENINFKIDEEYLETLILSNDKIMDVILNKTNFFLLGDSPSFPCKKSKFSALENEICGILNSFALLNFRVNVFANLKCSDYLKPNLRTSAKLNLPVTYIFNQTNFLHNDNFSIEHINALRLIPNVNVFKPCDINEIIGTWDYILKNGGTNILILSDEEMPIYKNTNSKYVKYGAYMIKKEKGNLQGILIATGAEIKLAMKVANELSDEGIEIRVVSMPSMELFLKQNPKYEEQLLPKRIKIFTLEAGGSHLWHRFASNSNTIIGINNFAKAGQPHELKNEFGFTVTKIKDKIKKELYKVLDSTEFL